MVSELFAIDAKEGVKEREKEGWVDGLQEEQCSIEEVSRAKVRNKSGLRRIKYETQMQANLIGLQPAKKAKLNATDIFIKYGNNPDGVPALLYAIKSNDLEAVKILLRHGASPNTYAKSDNWVHYAIDYAAAYSDVKMISHLEKHGAQFSNEDIMPIRNEITDVYQPSPQPLIVAIANDNAEVVKYLITNYPHLEKPIGLAVSCGAFHSFQVLIDSVIDISSIKGDLIFAASLGNQEVFLEFLFSNYGPFPQDKIDKALLHAVQSKRIEVIKVLLKWGANPNFSMRALPAQRYVVEAGSLPILQLFVSYGMKLNPEYGHNLFEYNAIYRCPEMVQFLVDQGISANTRYGYGTPLHRACEMISHNHFSSILDSVKILIAAGADVNAVQSTGRTPLYYACSGSTIIAAEIVQELFCAGANLQAYQEQYQPYLGNAHFKIIEILVNKGVCLGGVDSNQRPVFHQFLDRKDFKEILIMLIDKNKLDVNKQDKNGFTALHSAVYRGKLELIEFLADNGANLNLKDKSGKTPLDLAKIHHPELTSWLIERGAR